MRPINDADHSFWDHLSQTRAAEYAAEEGLARLPIPPAPAQTPLAAAPSAWRHDTGPVVHADAGLESDHWPEDPGLQFPAAKPARPDALWSAQIIPPDTAGPSSATKRTRMSRKKPALRMSGGGRLSYRLQRLWLTPLVRRAVTLGLPVAMLIVATVAYLADEGRRAEIGARVDEVYALVVDRPEFMVTGLELVQPVPPAIEAAIREVIAPALPVSSFRLDLVALRAELERLDAIRLADLRLTADGKLAVGITQRVPAILWRSADGLEVLDAEGVRIGFVTDRAALADLPLVAGDGANARVGEALDLFEAASPLGARVLGLVRMGERRWDVVLDREQTIRLPEVAPVGALERIIALDQAQGLLARDVTVTDLRNPARPILQVSAGALETIRALRGTSTTERNAP